MSLNKWISLPYETVVHTNHYNTMKRFVSRAKEGISIIKIKSINFWYKSIQMKGSKKEHGMPILLLLCNIYLWVLIGCILSCSSTNFLSKTSLILLRSENSYFAGIFLQISFPLQPLFSLLHDLSNKLYSRSQRARRRVEVSGQHSKKMYNAPGWYDSNASFFFNYVCFWDSAIVNNAI